MKVLPFVVVSTRVSSTHTITQWTASNVTVAITTNEPKFCAVDHHVFDMIEQILIDFFQNFRRTLDYLFDRSEQIYFEEHIVNVESITTIVATRTQTTLDLLSEDVIKISERHDGEHHE